MDVLPLVSLSLLGLVGAWFFWPNVVDPIMALRNAPRRGFAADADQTAETLFDNWQGHA